MDDFNVGVAGHKRKAALAPPVIPAYVSTSSIPDVSH